MRKIIIVMILLCFMTGCGKVNSEENAILNNQEGIIKEQTVNTFTMSNTSLRYQSGISTLTVTVTNHSSDTIVVNRFDIVFKTENGSMITTLNGSLGDQMEGNTSLTITVTSDIDLSEAYSLEYQID